MKYSIVSYLMSAVLLVVSLVPLIEADARIKIVESFELTGEDKAESVLNSEDVCDNGDILIIEDDFIFGIEASALNLEAKPFNQIMFSSFSMSSSGPIDIANSTLTWLFDSGTGTLTISGTGPMPNFTASTQPWISHRPNITKVVLENGVTSVGTSAFQSFAALKEIDFGTTVHTIGVNAFRSCASLESLDFTNSSVEIIGAGAFRDCTSLEKIDNFGAVKTIRGDGTNGAFAGCSALKDIDLNSVESIEIRAFNNTGIEELVIPASVTFIGPYAFQGNRLEKVTFDGVQIISPDSFWGCTGLKEIDFGTVHTIGNSAFRGCTALEDVDFKDVINIGENAFRDSINLKNINLRNVINIGHRAFNASGGSEIEELIIPVSVTSIGSYAFQGDRLKKVIFPAGVLDISPDSFWGSTGLTEIVFGPTVRNIGASAFRGCTSLTDVDFNYVESIGENAFRDSANLKNINLSNVTNIGIRAFANTGLTSVEIPGSIFSIGNSAFENCLALAEVHFPEDTQITIMNANVFTNSPITIHAFSNTYPHTYANVNSIPFVSLGNPSVPTPPPDPDLVDEPLLGSDLFWSYNSGAHILTISGTGPMPDFTGMHDQPWNDLKHKILLVIIEDEVTTIGDFAFSDISLLTNVIIGNSVTKIGEDAFFYCENLLNVVLPASVEVIGEGAFDGCTLLMSVLMSEGLTTIGDFAFRDCTSLTDITIPGTVTTIGDYAFNGCTQLTSVLMPDGLITIGRGAFRDCTSLTNITIPNTVTVIGDFTFRDCTSLTDITIPGTVTAIGQNAFRGCTLLEAVYFPNPNPTLSISLNAFDGSSNVIIHAPIDSFPIEFAIINGISYRLIGEAPEPDIDIPEEEHTHSTNPDNIYITNDPEDEEPDSGHIGSFNDDEGVYEIVGPRDEAGDEILYIRGADYRNFVGLWIGGILRRQGPLEEGGEYDAEEGSTRITIYAQTIQSLDNGDHVAVAAFTSETDSEELDIVAQKFTVYLYEPDDPVDPVDPIVPVDPIHPAVPTSPSSPSTPSGSGLRSSGGGNNNNQTAPTETQPLTEAPTPPDAGSETLAAGTGLQSSIQNVRTIPAAQDTDDGRTETTNGETSNEHHGTETSPEISGFVTDTDGNFIFEFDGKPMEFKLNLPYADFEGLYLNGEELEAGTDYTAQAGSTIIILAANRLSLLNEGLHTLEAVFAGETVEIAFLFTINEAAIEAPLAEEPLISAPPVEREATQNNFLLPIIIILAVILLAAVVYFFIKTKRSGEGA